MSSSGANNSTPTTGSSATPNGNSKEKEPFKVRAELFAPTRLAPKTYALFRARSLVTDVVAHECLLLVLLAAKSAMVSNATLRTEQPRVGILGGGHVGCAVVMALLKHAYPVDKLAISTRQPERTPKCEALLPQNACGGSLLPQYHAITKYYDNARLSRESDVVVLCMPPSQLKSVAIQIKHALGVGVSEAPPTLVVSVLCGASRELLQKSCGTKLVARSKVSVAKLTGAGVDADESDDGLKEDDDDTAVVVGNGEGSEERAASSSVESAARELGKQPLQHLCVCVFCESVACDIYCGLTDHALAIFGVLESPRTAGCGGAAAGSGRPERSASSQPAPTARQRLAIAGPRSRTASAPRPLRLLH